MQTYLGDGLGLDALLNHTSSVELAHRATDRANIYYTLSHIFNHAPDTLLVERLRSIDPVNLLLLGEQSERNEAVRQGLDEIAQFIEDARGQTLEYTAQELAKDWAYLFRGLSPGFGPQPPYESLYLKRRDDDIDTLLVLAHIYASSDATFEAPHANRQDYIGVELDYLRFLSQKEADAWLNDDSDAAWRWLSKVRTFLRQHLDLWATAYCDEAIDKARTCFYRGFMRICKATLCDLSS